MASSQFNSERLKHAREFLIYKSMEERIQGMDFPHLYKTLFETLGPTDALVQAKEIISGVITDRAKLIKLKEQGEISRSIRVAHIPVNAEVEVDLFDKQSFYYHGRLLCGVKSDVLAEPNRQLRLSANDDLSFTVHDDISHPKRPRPSSRFSYGDTVVLGMFVDSNKAVRTLVDPAIFWGEVLPYINLSSKRYGLLAAPNHYAMDAVVREQELLIGRVRVAGATKLH